VAPVITGIIIHFMFHICCISIHKLLCFSLCSAAFYMKFLSAGVAASSSMHLFPFLFLIVSVLFAVLLCLCVPLDSLTSSCSHPGLGLGVCARVFACARVCACARMRMHVRTICLLF
jgi:hypothetical protein